MICCKCGLRQVPQALLLIELIMKIRKTGIGGISKKI